MKYLVISRYKKVIHIENIFLTLEDAEKCMKQVLSIYLNKFGIDEYEKEKNRIFTNVDNKEFDLYIVKVETPKYLILSFFNRKIEIVKEYNNEEDAYFYMEELLYDYFEKDLDFEYNEKSLKRTKEQDWDITNNYAWCNKNNNTYEIKIIKI